MNGIKDFKYFYGYSKTFPIQRHLQQQDVYFNENSKTSKATVPMTLMSIYVFGHGSIFSLNAI